MKRCLLFLATCLQFFLLSAASPGDRLDVFQDCVRDCDILTCQNSQLYSVPDRKYMRSIVRAQRRDHIFDELPLSADLRLIGWNCFDNCDYQCQRIVTKNRRAQGLETLQFHGKWPFLRILGVQELFSTIFSIANFIPHYWGFKLLLQSYMDSRRCGERDLCNLYFSYMIISVAAMCAWCFSTVFHLRDTWNREKLDYYLAGATVLSGLYGVTVRTFQLFKTENDRKRKLFAAVLVLAYFGHLIRLSVDWSYTYNMRANVLTGVVQNFLWINHSLVTFKSLYMKENVSLAESSKSNVRFKNSKSADLTFKGLYRQLINPEVRWTLTPIFLVCSVIFGMSFELFDFPPVFDLVDAHAVWHFVTIWPAIVWYPYMKRDAQVLKDDKSE